MPEPPSRGGGGLFGRGLPLGLTGKLHIVSSRGAGAFPARVAQLGLLGPSPFVFTVTGSWLGLCVVLGGGRGQGE